MLTFPIATGQEETRKDGIETLNAIRDLKKKFPKVRTILGLSNISFGLNPAARQALNSVFLQEAVQVGLDAAIVDSGKILPLNQIPDENQIHLRNLIYDRREFDEQGTVTYDPLTAILEIYSSVNMSINSTTILDSLNDISIEENLRLRIVQGIGKKLENDLDKALEKYSALEIVNDHLLPGMKEVGDLFGAGVMQLPFVLQSAEVMKSSVNYLENFMEKTGKSGKGKVLLATVKGDVHDIGKNLVDIILTNNGYTVINIGIKQTIQQIIDAAEEHQVDIIGMSGLLVKSTVIMRENLEELNSRGLSSKYPIILGGAALTRSYVEDDLASIYGGVVRYAKDAFEGLSLVEKIMELKRTGVDNLPPVKQRIHARVDVKEIEQKEERSNVSLTNLVPSPPFFGTKVVKGISLLEVAKWLDERATFVGQWGLKPGRNSDMDLAELIEIEGRPRLRYWLDQIQRHSLNEMSVIYGYFPAYSNGNQILILDEPDGKEIETFSFPRQRTGEELCLADYVKPLGHPDNDFVAFHLVTMGSAISRFTANLFEANHYRDYLELHGLSVQLTEALAEMWHARIRAELKIDYEDADTLPEILKQSYRGERYSFGYPACPDLSLQVPLLRLLKPERIGVSLSEEFQLHPEQSTSAIIFHHPEARYFNAR
jgi:5-methyltetrahydrofolate--homocysteine methyltransferase